MTPKTIYKQRRSKPYLSNGKTTFNIQKRPGVYMIYKGEKPVYIGYSGTNLYKTLYRHFQSWNDRTQTRVVYRDLSDITVRVVYTHTGNQAAKLEKALIVKLKPRDNPNKYEQYTLTFKDKQNVTEFINLPARDIVRYDGDLPF